MNSDSAARKTAWCLVPFFFTTGVNNHPLVNCFVGGGVAGAQDTARKPLLLAAVRIGSAMGRSLWTSPEDMWWSEGGVAHLSIPGGKTFRLSKTQSLYEASHPLPLCQLGTKRFKIIGENCKQQCVSVPSGHFRRLLAREGCRGQKNQRMGSQALKKNGVV